MQNGSGLTAEQIKWKVFSSHKDTEGVALRPAMSGILHFEDRMALEEDLRLQLGVIFESEQQAAFRVINQFQKHQTEKYSSLELESLEFEDEGSLHRYLSDSKTRKSLQTSSILCK